MASCPNPVTGVSLTDCAAINYAAAIPISNLYDLTYTGARPAHVTPILDLPQTVQEALTGCTTSGCIAIGHDFSSTTNTSDTFASLPYIYDTKMTTQRDAAVILNDSVSPIPPVLSGIPGYDFFSTPFEIRNLTNGGFIHVDYFNDEAAYATAGYGNSVYDCADTCNRGSDCAGFNFSSVNGTCTFLPTGSATSTRNQATAYANDEWVKRFDSSNRGTAYRKKPLIPVNVNQTIPSYVDLSATGVYCRDHLACNNVISNALTIGTLTQFDTSDFDSCSGCPSKKYRTTGATVHTVTNEMGLSKTFTTKLEAKNALMYNGGTTAAHSVVDFPAGRIVTIKKLDGTTLFSNFNSNVNGTGTVSVGWRDSKNEPRKIFYDKVDYIINGYIITDMKSFEHYVPGNGSWTKELDPKYSSGYTSNVVAIT